MKKKTLELLEYICLSTSMLSLVTMIGYNIIAMINPIYYVTVLIFAINSLLALVGSVLVGVHLNRKENEIGDLDW